MGVLHYRPGGESRITLAFPTSENLGALCKPVRKSCCLAMRAFKPIGPLRFLQIGSTSSLVREKTLEFR